jgi:protocatechuate 3,4-dioxygenase beta subunit
MLFTKLILLLTFVIFIVQTQAQSCEPTPHRSTGTHYKPVTVKKVNIGKGIIVHGQILAAPNCTPVAHAKIVHWQGGEEGRYKDELYAYMFADDQGNYKFETEWPNMPTPHIHFIITADGYQTLETQWIGDERQSEIHFNMILSK